MSTKREAELETENRMLREQVAALERIVGQAVCHPVPALPLYPSWSPGYPGITWTSGSSSTVTLC